MFYNIYNTLFLKDSVLYCTVLYCIQFVRVVYVERVRVRVLLVLWYYTCSYTIILCKFLERFRVHYVYCLSILFNRYEYAAFPCFPKTAILPRWHQTSLSLRSLHALYTYSALALSQIVFFQKALVEYSSTILLSRRRRCHYLS